MDKNAEVMIRIASVNKQFITTVKYKIATQNTKYKVMSQRLYQIKLNLFLQECKLWILPRK